MKKYLIIHGHFYQPPRENPWTEEVGKEQSAFPYHNWNKRIVEECYSPNLDAIVLDEEKNLLDVVNNFQKINFNFGPTLLSWMEKNETETYSRILNSEKENAISQVYNHIIMPLSTRRDMRTEVLWGIKDFKYRFGKKPKGMWLPETAVSSETLEVLAECGIEFTILAPHQIRIIRKIKGEYTKKDIEKTSEIYLVRLNNGKSIKIVSYDNSISHKISFEGLLHSGDSFYKDIDNIFNKTKNNVLVIATDGEIYGHHHRFGEMALAYVLNSIVARTDIEIITLNEYLSMKEPEYEAEIVENTSWSCIHGIDRWRNDCGCSTGGKPEWNQKWRKPLREATDWLKCILDEIFENEGRKYIHDVWKARDDYVDILIQRSEKTISDFIDNNSIIKDDTNTVKILKLMEMQRNGLFMLTSCGWFFSDISGLESVQILKYAGRAIELAQDFIDRNLEDEFLGMLEFAKSNKNEEENGAVIYKKYVKPLTLNHKKAICHYGAFQLIDNPRNDLFSFTITELDKNESSMGDMSMISSHSIVKSLITKEQKEFAMVALRIAGIDFRFSIKEYDTFFEDIKEEISKRFTEPNLTEVTRLLDHNFGDEYFTLEALLPDVKEEILKLLSEDIIERFKDAYNTVYEENKGVMEYISKIGGNLPDGFLIAARYSLNSKLRDVSLMLDEDENSINEIVFVKNEAHKLNIQLDEKKILKRLSKYFTKLIINFIKNPQAEYLKSIISKYNNLECNGIGFDSREAQIHFYKSIKNQGKRNDIIKIVGDDLFLSLLRMLHINNKTIKFSSMQKST